MYRVTVWLSGLLSVGNSFWNTLIQKELEFFKSIVDKEMPKRFLHDTNKVCTKNF